MHLHVLWTTAETPPSPLVLLLPLLPLLLLLCHCCRGNYSGRRCFDDTGAGGGSWVITMVCACVCVCVRVCAWVCVCVCVWGSEACAGEAVEVQRGERSKQSGTFRDIPHRWLRATGTKCVCVCTKECVCVCVCVKEICSVPRRRRRWWMWRWRWRCWRLAPPDERHDQTKSQCTAPVRTKQDVRLMWDKRPDLSLALGDELKSLMVWRDDSVCDITKDYPN